MFGCAEPLPPLKSICRDHGIERPCSGKEQGVIDGMHAIISAVRYFEPKSNSFLAGELNHDHPQVMLFGEDHTRVIARIETLGFINYILRPGDIVLLEGADWKSGAIPRCGMLHLNKTNICMPGSGLNWAAPMSPISLLL